VYKQFVSACWRYVLWLVRDAIVVLCMCLFKLVQPCMWVLLCAVLQFPSSYIARDDEVAELVLSMADVSTNLVMLTGKCA
jgi:hypothetical protein